MGNAATEPQFVVPSRADVLAARKRASESRGSGESHWPTVRGLTVPAGLTAIPVPSDRPEADQHAVLARWEARKGRVPVRDGKGDLVRFEVDGFSRPCYVVLTDYEAERKERAERRAPR